jgi:hypothetical protein
MARRPNWARGEAELPLSERTVLMRPTFAACLAIEDETGRSLVDLTRRLLSTDGGTLAQLGAIAGNMAGEDSDAIGREIYGTNATAVSVVLGLTLAAALRGGMESVPASSDEESDDRFAYRHLMGIACDTFGWTPQAFWDATPHELFAMIEARRAANKAGGAE